MTHLPSVNFESDAEGSERSEIYAGLHLLGKHILILFFFK